MFIIIYIIIIFYNDKANKFGSDVNVNLPYQTTEAGIIRIYLDPKVTSNQYAYISGVGSNARINMMNGYGSMATFPVEKGATVSLGSNSGTQNFTVYAYFRTM